MGVEEDARRISVAVPQGRNDECLNQGSGNGGGEEGKRAPGSQPRNKSACSNDVERVEKTGNRMVLTCLACATCKEFGRGILVGVGNELTFEHTMIYLLREH